MENLEKKEQIATSRRAFLIKAAYVAPVVVGLGALSAPVTAHASVFHGDVLVTNTKTNVTTKIGDAYIDGESGPQIIKNGSYVKLSNGQTTNYTADQVKSNDTGLFSWAINIFKSISA